MDILEGRVLVDNKGVNVYPPSQAGCQGGVQTGGVGEVGDDAEHSPAHHHQIMLG